jgi:porphobilinogen synthase
MARDAGIEMVAIADLCFCEYTEHGHCGVLDQDPRVAVDNDATLENLGKQAMNHAEAGFDIVAPSGMMDGMVAAIRQDLDGEGHENVAIMSYAIKYASAFYGPFRDAVQSAPSFGDRRGYQMDVRNWREAMREAAIDQAEGADILMVKPGMPCLDVLARLREETDLPLAAYQVSGEYAMIKAAGANGWFDGDACMREAMQAFKRAGANMVITYAALELAESF